MRSHIVAASLAASLAVALAGCAGSPVRDPATISYEGQFGGTVVADRTTPIASRYQNLCAGQPGRWRYGGYRPYGECPPAPAVVRARY